MRKEVEILLRKTLDGYISGEYDLNVGRIIEELEAILAKTYEDELL